MLWQGSTAIVMLQMQWRKGGVENILELLSSSSIILIAGFRHEADKRNDIELWLHF